MSRLARKLSRRSTPNDFTKPKAISVKKAIVTMKEPIINHTFSNKDGEIFAILQMTHDDNYLYHKNQVLLQAIGMDIETAETIAKMPESEINELKRLAKIKHLKKELEILESEIIK